ncbi:hypothetical protein THASP1DRAFT_32578 [Thamnocephalis sphaerospora]|uniref:Arb2 domain-containing protein n=1 Tax=Thamnocephalis sphaerospora TaxID=78915 RepID=A0A4P9XIP3_9FUNG|nr:hypothetical protein THASP1DRAFT_32578 [Thamnocephalis sphaerospora]|eukprot:RKP05582.1 hypothetical protein THASP1DRAFT_32578 [Thamnocephalis sphaerospora]
MFRRKRKVIVPKPVFPKTLDELHFTFSEAGQLRNTETGEPFKFRIATKTHPFVLENKLHVSGGKMSERVSKLQNIYNETHLAAVGEAVGTEVERRLVEQLRMQQVRLPLGKQQSVNSMPIVHNGLTGVLDGPCTCSDDFTVNAEKLIVLIPSLNARVGQWDRRILFDESIDNGSIFNYVRQAAEEGYAVLATNPNGNYWRHGKSDIYIPYGKRYRLIPGNESPENHIDYIFENIVSLSPAKEIYVVAHGNGAQCVIRSLAQQYELFSKRVAILALLDSVHSAAALDRPALRVWLREHAINWMRADELPGMEVKDPRFGCRCIASGTEQSAIHSDEQRKAVFSAFRGELESLEPDEEIGDVNIAILDRDQVPEIDGGVQYDYYGQPMTEAPDLEAAGWSTTSTNGLDALQSTLNAYGMAAPAEPGEGYVDGINSRPPTPPPMDSDDE